MSTMSRIARGLKLAAAPLALAGLAACASPFNADVSRFQSQLPAPQGQTFAVVADDPALAGGLEFSRYADLVAQEMAELGYTRAASPDNATLLVRFDYGVDDGRERVVSRPSFYRDPFFSPWMSYRPMIYRDRSGGRRVAYVPSRSWGYGFHPGYFGYGFGGFGGFGGYGRDIDSYTVYTSGIALKIDRAATGERLFEGNAQAMSSSNRLQYLVPNLVEAMFTDFPGNSGETVRISIKPEDQPVQPVRR